MKIIKIIIPIAVISLMVFFVSHVTSASIPATGGTTITLGIPGGWASAYPPYGPSLPPLTFTSGVPLTISTASMGTYLYYSLACCATAQLSAVSDGSTVTLSVYGSTYGAGESTQVFTLGALSCPAGYTLSGTNCILNTGTINVSSNIATSWTITPGPIFGSGTSMSYPSATSGPTTYAITWDPVVGYDFPPTTLISASQTLTTGGTISFNGTYTLTPTVPTVTTPTVSGITTNGATLGATLSSLGITTDGTLSVRTDYASGNRPVYVIISTDGTSVYTANKNSNTVSMFTRNTSTGTLSAKTDYPTGSSPSGITISADGTSVYVTNRNANTISMFTRNTSDGTLSAKTDYPTGTSPSGITISADGNSVYVTNQNTNNVSMFTRNTSDGTLSAKTDYPTGTSPFGIIISAGGNSVYVTNRNANTISMFTRNTSNGTLSAKTDYPTGQGPVDVTISTDGTSVYTSNLNANTVSMFTRNTSNGTLSAKTDYPTGASPSGITISADGNSVYVTNQNTNNVSMFTRNTSNGTLSAKTDYPAGQVPSSVTISTDGTSVYTSNLNANTVSMFTRNTTIPARGTCWGLTLNPTTNCTAEGGTTIGVFTQSRTGMNAGTTYHYRGYATNSTGTGYSPDATFRTADPITCPSAFGNINEGNTLITHSSGWPCTQTSSLCLASGSFNNVPQANLGVCPIINPQPVSISISSATINAGDSVAVIWNILYPDNTCYIEAVTSDTSADAIAKTATLNAIFKTATSTNNTDLNDPYGNSRTTQSAIGNVYPTSATNARGQKTVQLFYPTVFNLYKKYLRLSRRALVFTS